MSPITTHILDTSAGHPAAGVHVELSRAEADDWLALARAVTNADGRIGDLLPAGVLAAGTYRLRFHTRDYFEARGQRCFYPHVDVVFSVDEQRAHYHVPLLLNPYGYSTYRGS